MMINNNLASELSEKGWVPDGIIRTGIRALLERRLVDIKSGDTQAASQQLHEFMQAMDKAPIAPLPEKANEQHYEVPAEFYRHVLGSHLKYSCGYWGKYTRELDASESLALGLTCEHAEIEDGMKILELGCGWGSLTLWMAKHYPNAQITAISNSASQRAMIAPRYSTGESSRLRKRASTSDAAREQSASSVTGARSRCARRAQRPNNFRMASRSLARADSVQVFFGAAE